jgi:hypothetical protein
MDPIHPITPGPPAIAPASRLPVDPPQRISRERDRPARDDQRGRAREQPPDPQPEQGEDESDGTHIDIRA